MPVIDPTLFADLKESILKNNHILLNRVLNHINNKSTVAQIAEASKTKLEYVRDAIQHLILYEIVDMQPVFKFSNRYMYTDDFKIFLMAQPLDAFEQFEECSDFLYCL